MQIAYLIVAHHQPHHFARLIKTLDGPECAFFIHIDAKVDETAFREAVKGFGNVVFMEHRIEVTWGGFSLVEATLALLHAAVSFGPSFHRFCLLSGSDFPIKPNARILADFNSTREFMRVDRKLKFGEDTPHNRYVGVYWFIDSADALLKNLSGTRMRQPYHYIGLYHGSAWWALTRDCVEYILRFVSSNDGEFYSFFRATLCSDEIFFHSIVKQSPFASRITHDFETAPDQAEYFRCNEHGCHYIDWNAPSGSLPKVLDPQDFHRLLHSNSLFARKFDEQRSGGLIRMLESALTSTTPGLDAEDRPKRKPGLETHPADDQFVIREAGSDQVYYLNPTAALILEFCDGEHSVGEITTLVREAYSLPDAPAEQVYNALANLISEGLIQL